MLNKIKPFLYKKRRQLYKLPKQYFQQIFWEHNIDNLYYGHYNILKKYSKIILPYKINGEVQHGWSPNHGIPSNPLLQNSEDKNKRYYLINEDNKKKSIHYGYNNVHVIGAPFIYLPGILEKDDTKSPNSLILFPLHTTEYDDFKDSIASYKNYIKELKKIIHFFNFITVSLGWREFDNKKIVGLFENEGIKVITMGHRDNNPKFLHNFVKIVRCHEYVSSDSFSSAIFYSLLMRKKVFIYGKHMGEEVEINWKGMVKDYQKLYKQRYPELKWENFSYRSYPEIGEKELGLSFKLSPKKMREVFGWSMSKIF